MVRWLRWHCPPDTGFEIRALAVWGRARYLSVTEAPHNTNFHTWMGKKQFCFFQTAETGNRTPDSGVKGSGANHHPRAPALQLRTPEPSEVVSVKSYCLCGGQEYIVHNLHCFWQIRMVSVRPVTDITNWSLPSQIIGSTRGLLTPGTRTGARDSEVSDSHTTIWPRELPQCFQSRRSSQDRL